MRKGGYARAEWSLIGVFFVLGLVGTLLGGATFLRALASRGWPTTPGKIVVSEVEDVSGADRAGVNVFCPRVEYVYFLDGQECTGSRIFFGSPDKYSKGQADRMARAFPVGQEVSVAYDPKDPERAVLRPGLVWEGASFTLAIGIGGALLLVVSAAALAQGIWRVLRRGKDTQGAER